MATASHFARLSYLWGRGLPAVPGRVRSRDELAYRPLKAYSAYVDGSVAVSPSPGPGPTSIYLGVFDPNFQTSVARLQEDPIFRRSGHTFHNNHSSTGISYLEYGELERGDCYPMFVGVEANLYGAVSVYFREYTKAATIDELVWWICRAWWMAMEVHWLLGTSGDGHLAVVSKSAVLSDLPTDKSGHLELEHGPFPLTSAPLLSSFPNYWGLNYGDPETVAWRHATDECKELVSKNAASLRADVRHQLLGEPREDADPGWTTSAISERLMYGRELPKGRRDR